MDRIGITSHQIYIGKLVISIMCITKSIDKYLQEFQNFHDLYFSNKPNILQIVTLNQSSLGWPLYLLELLPPQYLVSYHKDNTHSAIPMCIALPKITQLNVSVSPPPCSKHGPPYQECQLANCIMYDDDNHILLKLKIVLYN